MLELTVPGQEHFDEIQEVFVTVGDVTLELEHSLVSLSKWESFYEKPFLSKEEKTVAETLFYIKCMTLTPEIPPEVFPRLTEDNFIEVNNYIAAKMTATWFTELPGAPKSQEVVTSELIYYWLISFSIPFSVETWNLNRLLTLIRVCSVKNAKPKKMTRGEQAEQQRRLNEERRNKSGSKG